jgi:hypothetical protein
VAQLERDLHGLPKDDFGRSRLILQKFLLQARGLECLSASAVGKCYKPIDQGEFPIAQPTDEDRVVVLDAEDERRFTIARDGDFLLTPFQCDFCHFRNLLEHDPIGDLPQDVGLLKLVRRANLVALWSREPGTVNSTLLLSKQGGRIAKALGIRDKLF